MSDRPRPNDDSYKLTVDQVAARGDCLRLKCFACDKARVFPAAKYLAKHRGKIVAELRPRCDDCFRRRRRGPGLDQPGYCTAIMIVPKDFKPPAGGPSF